MASIPRFDDAVYEDWDNWELKDHFDEDPFVDEQPGAEALKRQYNAVRELLRKAAAERRERRGGAGSGTGSQRQSRNNA